MSYCEAHVKVRHAGDFISLLSKYAPYPSVLTHFYLSGSETIGLLLFLVNDSKLTNTVIDLAHSVNIIKELTPLRKDFPVFYVRKLSFGIQKALMELGLPKPNLIYHDVLGNKHFVVIMPPHLRGALVSNVKKNALTVGEKSVSVKISLKPSISRHLHVIPISDKKSASANNRRISYYGNLTALEHYILWEAYIMGYFEWPKRSSLEDLSQKLSMSKATILEHLRKALKKVVKEYFTVHG